MKLRVGDTLSAKRGDLTITGTVSRVEAEGFWIESPDGMSYRFTLGPEPGQEDPPPKKAGG
jgi:hypothetical protein